MALRSAEGADKERFVGMIWMKKTIKELDIYISDGNYSSKYPRSEEFVEEGIPFIRGNNMVDGDITDDEMYHITPEKHSILLKGHVKAGDVLITTRGNIGQVAIVPDRHEDSNINAQIVLLRTNQETLYNRYLLWALQSREAKEQYLALQTGTALKQLPVGKLEKLYIEATDINKQHKIADVFDKTYKVIKLRRKELQLLDELIKARFVEMFGDPIQNPKGWDKPLIEDVVAKEKNALKAGPFGSALKKEYYVESGYKIYGQEQVISGDYTLGDYYIDEDRYKTLENCAVQAGDVLISLVGTYGKLLIMPKNFEPGIINPRLMKITFDKEKINPYYFKYFFQSEALKRSLSENTHGGTMEILNLGIVRKIEIPVPPLGLQNKFVLFVNQVDKSKVTKQIDSPIS